MDKSDILIQKMQKICLVYIGTSEIAAPLLQALAKGDRFEVRLVVTAPDQPAGRKLELQPSPVKKAAQDLGFNVFQPRDINAAESLLKIRELKPDFLVLMAYGQILSEEVLKIPKKGCINIHPSLLPRWRGASPVQSALLEGDAKTGVSLMQMVAQMDAGPVFMQWPMPIAPEYNAITLSEKLAELTAARTPDALAQIAEGNLKAKPQNETQATLCTKIQKSDGQIKWDEPAELIARRVRAYAGWPGTWTRWNGKMLKILEAGVALQAHSTGQVTADSGRIYVGTGLKSLELIKVQLEGKNPLFISEFIKGHPSFIGSILGG